MHIFICGVKHLFQYKLIQRLQRRVFHMPIQKFTKKRKQKLEKDFLKMLPRNVIINYLANIMWYFCTFAKFMQFY